MHRISSEAKRALLESNPPGIAGSVTVMLPKGPGIPGLFIITGADYALKNSSINFILLDFDSPLWQRSLFFKTEKSPSMGFRTKPFSKPSSKIPKPAVEERTATGRSSQ
jgi:hypothetical protein